MRHDHVALLLHAVSEDTLYSLLLDLLLKMFDPCSGAKLVATLERHRLHLLIILIKVIVKNGTHTAVVRSKRSIHLRMLRGKTIIKV